MARAESPARDLIRFDGFELDVQTGELWNAGAVVRLQPQPARLLALLAAHSGELVTRDELRKGIWGEDTFVDFDQSLNFCVRQLRTALGDAADSPRFIETLPRRGYRFIAPVIEPEHSTDMLRPPARAGVRARLPLVLAAFLTVSAIAVVVWRLQPPGGGDQERVLLAVLPFENLSGDPGQDYLGDGLTDEMIARLAQVRPDRLGVVARTSAMQYKESKKSVAQIGRELGVRYVIEGSVRRDGNRVRINVQLIDVDTQALIWARSFERTMDEIIALEAAVVAAVAEAIQVPLSPARHPRRASSSQKVDPETYEAYLKGRFFWRRLTREDVEKAIGYFEQAARLTPDYAPAYAGLADAYYALSNLHLDPAAAMKRADEAARRALELDPELAEAHCAVALIALYHRWDWSGAEQAFRRAIELGPGSAEIRTWYGVYLALIGREDEALAELEYARGLDPLSLLVNWTMGLPLYFSGRYDEGIERTRQALELNPEFYLAHSGLGTLYEAKGDFQMAVAALRRACELSDSPELLAFLGRALAVSGDRPAARRILAELSALPSPRHVSPYDLALVYDGLGEGEEAIRCLEEAFRRRAEPMIGLRLDPRMKNLLRDPRVADLVKRMKLPAVR